MASPGGEPSGKDKQDPMARMVPLAELKATVAELMKEVTETQREEETKVDNLNTSRTGR